MLDTTILTRSERQTLADYDRQRRLRLANGIATVLSIISAVSLVFIIISLVARSRVEGDLPPISDPTWGIFALTLCIGTLFEVGSFAARRDRADLAAGAVVAAIAVGSLGYLFLTNHGHVLGPHTYLGLLGITTVLVSVGYLGSRRTLVGAALAVNAVTVLTLLLGQPFPSTGAAVAAAFHTPGLTENTFLVLDHTTALKMIPALVILQWVLVALIIAGGNTYRQALRDLGDVRVALARAHQIEDLKDQFITTVNHELRNPVMRMQIYVELLRLKGHEMDAPKRTELILQASTAGKALIKLISNILDVRQIDRDATDLVFASVPVGAITRIAAGLVAGLEGETGNRPLHLDIPDDLTVWADETRLQQILTNLLSNAAKYSPEDSPIEVCALPVAVPAPKGRVRPAEPAPAQVEITVRDYGLGISPEEAPVLFQRFARLPRDLASDVVGSGLGLFLCRVYAESMGGQIWVESTGIEGEGSIFHLRLQAGRRG